jgi:hypothetical protein
LKYNVVEGILFYGRNQSQTEQNLLGDYLAKQGVRTHKKRVDSKEITNETGL